MIERDYAAAWAKPVKRSYLPNSSIELVNPIHRGETPLYALFDFDGTLSLIREGWMEVMVPMMVKELLPYAKPYETEAAILRFVKDYVSELTGKQTIYQMMRLADELSARGARPRDPQDYKDEYHGLLMQKIEHRRRGLVEGRIRPEDLLVPGSVSMLSALRERGVTIYVASGTDENYVLEEAQLLGIDRFAPGRIFGAKRDFRSYSKELVIKRILKEHAVDGARLVAFGDGYVEISDCKAVGGIAVGVASDEAGRSGKTDEWKRERLIGAGADVVIPDYRESDVLLDYLWAQCGQGPLVAERR